MTDDKNVTINNLYLFIPNLKPSVETQLMYNEATQKNYRISYDEYLTERRVKSGILVQHDIGSAKQLNFPKYLISAYQMKDRILTPNKASNKALFDNLDLGKYYVEIDGQRYPRDGLSINYTKNDYIDQYRDLKLFFEEYIEEAILNPLISYPDMKTQNNIGIRDLRQQLHHITFKRIRLFQEYGTDPDNARLFLIFIKQGEIELISDGKKLIEVKVLKISFIV